MLHVCLSGGREGCTGGHKQARCPLQEREDRPGRIKRVFHRALLERMQAEETWKQLATKERSERSDSPSLWAQPRR